MTASRSNEAAVAAGPVPTRSEFALGWKTLLAAFLGTMCGASPLPVNVLGFLFDPLNAEFGWSKTQISIGVTIYGLTAALLAPFYGAMCDRYGVRRVGISSLIAFAVIFASFYLMPGQLAFFYGIWFLIGLVAIGSTPVSWSRAIGLWFVRNRGLALGIMMLGTSAAAIVVPRIAVAAIEFGGWRMIFPAVALLPILIAVPAVLALFREPRADEMPPQISAGADGSVAGMTLGKAMRTRQFWLLWVSILLISLAYGGAHTHMPAIIKDHGLGIGDAAGIMGIVGLGLLSGRLIVGALLDRFWGPGVGFPVLCLPALACYLLLGTGSDFGMIALAAFLLGFAAGAESDLIAFLAARYFGMAQFGRIYGFLYMPFATMTALSPVLYGIVRDTAGSYDPMLAGAALMFVTGGALLLLMGGYDRLKWSHNED